MFIVLIGTNELPDVGKIHHPLGSLEESHHIQLTGIAIGGSAKSYGAPVVAEGRRRSRARPLLSCAPAEDVETIRHLSIATHVCRKPCSRHDVPLASVRWR